MAMDKCETHRWRYRRIEGLYSPSQTTAINPVQQQKIHSECQAPKTVAVFDSWTVCFQGRENSCTLQLNAAASSLLKWLLFA